VDYGSCLQWPDQVQRSFSRHSAAWHRRSRQRPLNLIPYPARSGRPLPWQQPSWLDWCDFPPTCRVPADFCHSRPNVWRPTSASDSWFNKRITECSSPRSRSSLPCRTHAGRPLHPIQQEDLYAWSVVPNWMYRPAHSLSRRRRFGRRSTAGTRKSIIYAKRTAGGELWAIWAENRFPCCNSASRRIRCFRPHAPLLIEPMEGYDRER